MAKTIKFLPIRTINSELSNIPIINGQFILVTDTKKLYTDYNDGSADKRTLITSSIEDFSSEKDYAVSDLVIYNNSLYKCITASKGEFNEANWQLIGSNSSSGSSSTANITIFEPNKAYKQYDLVLYEDSGTMSLWMRNSDGADAAWNGANWTKVSGGADGTTPSIDATTKHWMIGTTDTGIVAEGKNGTDGTDGATPSINANTKHWTIGETDTGVVAEGKNGENAYLYIKYSAIEPTQDSDMKDTIDEYIGIANGNSETAPTAYTDYQWFKIRGDKGEIGNSSYTFIKYSAIEPISNTDMKDTPDEWMGIAIVNENQAPAEYTSYTWYKIKGSVEITTDCVVLYATFLAANWVDNNGIFTQQVAVTDISASNVPIVDIKLSDDSTLWADEKNSYGCVDKMETFDGYIIATCGTKKPSADFTVKMKIAGDLTGQTVVTQSEYDTLVKNISTVYTGTFLTEGWSDTVPFQQTVTITDLTESINPTIDLVISDDVTTGINENTQWSYLTKAVISGNSVIGYCYETKPTIPLNFKIKGV